MKHYVKWCALITICALMCAMVSCNHTESPDNDTTIITNTNLDTAIESLPETQSPDSSLDTTPETITEDVTSETTPDITIQDPATITVADLNHTLFNGTDAFIVVNNNIPFFTDDEITAKSFEQYAPLDTLGRCGVTFACIGQDLMPTKDRESISSVYPSGWKYHQQSNNKQYDFVDGTYVYNRCHLIGFQLTGENANKQNLITGTRYLNINGMLAFENMIADAVRENNIHVLYRVTPIFIGDNLLAEGVLMEGYSVEDAGETIQFCLFAFNVQPGVEFDYATGDNWLAITEPDETTSAPDTNVYVLNTNSKKFHMSDCSATANISSQNRETHVSTREALINDGYSPCGICNP